MVITESIIIRDNGEVILNGAVLPYEERGLDLLLAIYRREINDWPKFYKMDTLSKLGFLASELLLKEEKNRFVPRQDRAGVLFNRSGSLCDDIHYQGTIKEGEAYFPSPSIFVYTLPNIVTGEIAIRNKYYGETSFYVLEKLDMDAIERTMQGTFSDKSTNSAIGGWVECSGDNSFEAKMFLAFKD